jgi:catechol 2,3-dioxygenase-like lactoylglutathione lyase family enzyme
VGIDMPIIGGNDGKRSLGRVVRARQWALAGASLALGATLSARAEPPPATRGLQEVVVSVRDLDASARRLRAVSGWTERYRGRVSRERLVFWGLPAAASARESLLGLPSSGHGLLRLVQFDGVPRVEIRSSSRPFDTGGIFNVNVLVRDIDAVFASMQAAGFQGFADPSRYEIFGRPYAGAVLRGQDGIVFNLLARASGGYDDLPAFGAMSHIRNSTQIVADFEQNRRFFEEQLGWVKRWEDAPKWEASGRNNMALPESLVVAGQVRERAASFAPDAEADGGTLEILAFEGIRGRDYAERARPPNLGMVVYVIMVPGLDAYVATIRARGVPVVAEPARLWLPPYGTRRVATIRSPSGSWLMLVAGS